MKKNVISVDEYCRIHDVDVAFIDYLVDNGLVQLIALNGQRFIPHEALNVVGRLTSWHVELEVNPAGLEVANRLYERVLELQEEVRRLRRALKNA